MRLVTILMGALLACLCHVNSAVAAEDSRRYVKYYRASSNKKAGPMFTRVSYIKIRDANQLCFELATSIQMSQL